jgi:H+-translocating NAD(P) transhydrogenase subunit beta
VSIDTFIPLAYLVSIGVFVVGLKRLSKIRTARNGNLLLVLGMFIAVIIAIVEQGLFNPLWVLVGLAIGTALGLITLARSSATSMPQIVARFNGFGGAASALVALSLFWQRVIEVDAGSALAILEPLAAGTLALSVVIGGVTLSGSVIAELKLWDKLGRLGRIPARSLVLVLAVSASLALAVLALATTDPETGTLAVIGLVVVALIGGFALVGPVGGADMPVMISLLNSLSGLAAAATGFALSNALLIMAGTIVGAAGLMLTQIMCVAMNRSLLNVIAGGMGSAGTADPDAQNYERIISTDAEEVAMLLEIAQSVIIVPGYGLAASRAQHAAGELAKVLAARGVNVRFAIHPVAGRMPGHMNVVLAEANVPYEMLLEMDQINRDFANTDLAIVIGANDVTNPAAKSNPTSPIAGMPILNVADARRIVVIKRSLSPGYAGVKNELFDLDNCSLLFDDAKAALDALVNELTSAK